MPGSSALPLAPPSAPETGTTPPTVPGTVRPGRWNDRVVFAIIAASGMLLYALNVDFLLHGDPAMYADYVLQSKFDELTLHIGYYAVVWVFHHTLGALLGLPIQETLVWVNVCCGGLALGFMYLLARRFLPTQRDALICAVILALCGRVLENATSAEMYMLQTCVVMASFLVFVDGKLFLAGMIAGAGLLVSPLSVFAYLFYPVYDFQRSGGFRWRAALRFMAGLLLVYLPYFVVDWRELFWGHRGLLIINSGDRFLPLLMMKNVPTFLFKHYTALLLLLVPAVWAVRRERRFLWLTLAVVLPHLYIASKLTFEDNVFLLNTDFFIAVWLVLGWRELERFRSARLVPPVLLLVHVGLYIASGQLFSFETHRGNAAEMRRIARQYILGHDATMVAAWDQVMVLTFYGRPRIVSTIERDPLFRQMYDIGAVKLMDPRKLNAANIYLLESWSPGPLNALLKPPANLLAAGRTERVLDRAASLGLRCSLLERTTFPLYRCVRQPPAPSPGAST